jgi:catechol 2,3-dioxygenase-like lactoylglutathione lyase family enzyme
MKTHLNFRAADLTRSVTFYSVLLAAEPVKRHGDYALFITEDPGLELALDRGDGARQGETAHYGIAVDSVADVDRAIDRLRAAAYPTDVEVDETCCYARQTKVWTSDPDGRRWEIYTVLEETEERDNADTTCCRDDASTSAACCSA